MKDCHIHYMPSARPADPPAEFLRKAALAEVDGGTIFSLPPRSFEHDPDHSQQWRDRLKFILEYAAETPGFHPFFWFDPTEDDAKEQIKAAADAGIHGFKCICNHFYPHTQLDKFALIAGTGLPLHFHSGILFDQHVSAEFNRPIAFECLIGVKNLKFALAHVGWPWCDEYIALYGKFRAARNHEQKMYIDLTPGTPMVYRREVLRKLYLTGYDLAENVLWGSDSQINDYSYEDALIWRKTDREILDEIKPGLFDKATESNFSGYYSSRKLQ